MNRRRNGRRLVEVFYTPPGDEGDGGDAESPGTGESPAAPLWGRWGPVLGETAGLGKLAKPVGRKPPSLPFLAALAEGKRDAKPFPF